MSGRDGGAEGAAAEPLLSEELAEQLGTGGGNDVVLAGRKKRKRKGAGSAAQDPETVELAAKLSKSKRKKLQQIADRKAKAAKRGEVYASLSKTKLKPNQRQLMRSSGELGAHETLRTRLRRVIGRAMEGLELTDEEMNLARRQDALIDVEESLGLQPGQGLVAMERACGRYVPPSPSFRTSIGETSGISKPTKAKAAHIKPASSSPSLKEAESLHVSEKPSSDDSARSAAAGGLPDFASGAVLEPPVDHSYSRAPDPEIDSSVSKSRSSSTAEDTAGAGPSWAGKMMAGIGALKLKKAQVTAAEDCTVVLSEEDCANSLSALTKKKPYVVHPLPLPNPAAIHAAAVAAGISTELPRSLKDGELCYCPIERSSEMQAQRMKLPVCGMEQEIVEAMEASDIVVLCGETGSGKSTQCVQFAYEAGYARRGLIGVTQPRRVAAISTAKRVAEEMGTSCGRGGEVAYQVRHDSQGVGPKTKVKFMTDGILLKELSSDLLLRKYSVIFLDEAHERGLNTDILLGMLSRAVPLRRKLAEESRGADVGFHPLKIIIMSATLAVAEMRDNRSLFPTPPRVITVKSRQFPVTIHFSKRTEMDDYVGATFRKISRIHRQLPPGGILAFLTGRQEIQSMCKKLTEEFNTTSSAMPRTAREKRTLVNASEDDQSYREADDEDEDADVVEGDSDEEEGGADAAPDEEEQSGEGDNHGSAQTVGPVWVVPLYAMLTPEDQARAFAPAPPGHRLVVVATNVAETSVTLPGISYVVDSGRSKRRIFHPGSSISSFGVDWISQASANQRAGRAGRVGPGHCYRLYSSAIFTQQFPEFNEPEVLTRTLEDVVLHMKAVGVPHLQRFPFPTPPDSATLRAAQLLLRNLGALGREFSRSSPAPGSGDSVADGPITSMGRAMSLLPLSARHARMLILAKQAGVMEHGIAMVAILAESEPFLGRKGNLWRHPVSDALGRLQAVGAYAHAVGRGQCSKEFCEEHQLHAPSMERVMQLRSQLTRLANLRFGNETGWVKLNPRGDLAPPTPAQSDLLRQAVLGGLLDHVARRVYGVGKSPTRAYYSACTGSYSSALVVSSRSGLHTENPADMPAWLVFADVKEVGKRGDLAMQCCTAIDPEWLAVLAADSPLLRLSGPVEQPAPQYDTVRDMVMTHVSPRYGDQSWDLPLHRVPLREVAGQEAQYRWVARLLLEGRIDPSFAPLGAAGVLSDSPAVLTRGFTLDPPPPLMLQKASQIVNDLASKNVWSMESLRREWSCNPNFLRSTILLWVRKEGAKKEIFRKAWSEAQKKVARQT